jgi:hypothetical protein
MNTYYYNQLVQSLLSFSECALKSVSTPSACSSVRQEIVKHLRESASKDLEDIEAKVRMMQ